MSNLSRRSFVKSIGATSLATAAPLAATPLLAAADAAVADPQVSRPQVTHDHPPRVTHDHPLYLFFNGEEAAFIEAACERLIPGDDVGPGALDAGVPNYLDKQLGGAWGSGERLYRSGPWQQGTPSQGYQLPFTPAELFRAALHAIQPEFKDRAFKDLPPDQQDAYLKSLEAGGKDLGGVPSAVFFQLLLQMTVEGYFSDPVYGGNKDMAAWKMIGFPGAYASYYDLIDKHGVKLEREPMSLASDRNGMIHVHPEIPASL
jgi:gluconate 2-dehydrogenase gamma chain